MKEPIIVFKWTNAETRVEVCWDKCGGFNKWYVQEQMIAMILELD